MRSDLLIIPQALCVAETLSRKGLYWPSLCVSQGLDKGTKRAQRWQCRTDRVSHYSVQSHYSTVLGHLSRRLNFYPALESGNAIGAFLQTPAPVLDKNFGPMGARSLSSTALGSGNLIERAQSPPQHPHWTKIGLPLSETVELSVEK